MKQVKFVVFGPPKPHQRPRFGKWGRIYSPPDQVIFQKQVAKVALAAAHGIFFDSPVSVACKFRSKHMVKDKKHLETWGGKYDLDNALKNILDALNGVVYKDDRLVCRVEADKQFTEGEEHTLVEISEIET